MRRGAMKLRRFYTRQFLYRGKISAASRKNCELENKKLQHFYVGGLCQRICQVAF